MTFALNNAGVGCYSLIFRGEHIGAVFSCEEEEEGGPAWTAIIHDAWAAKAAALPVPFSERRHRFRTLQDIKRWLGLGAAAPLEREASSAA